MKKLNLFILAITIFSIGIFSQKKEKIHTMGIRFVQYGTIIQQMLKDEAGLVFLYDSTTDKKYIEPHIDTLKKIVRPIKKERIQYIKFINYLQNNGFEIITPLSLYFVENRYTTDEVDLSQYNVAVRYRIPFE